MSDLSDRELDAWLAEHLFGWRVDGNRRGNWQIVEPEKGAFALVKQRGREWSVSGSPFNPFSWWASTGDGMLLVIEKMRERGYGVVMDARAAGNFVALFGTDDDIDWLDDCYQRTSTTLPRAVADAARAALEASK